MIAHSTIAPADRAYRHLSAHLVFWLTCALGLALDLWTKDWAWKRFYREDHQERSMVIIDGFLKLTAVTNKGALFGLGQGWVFFFIIASIAAIGVVLYLFGHSHKRQWGMHLAAGLILAGAIGNLYDRWHMGYVRDFIHFYKVLHLGGWDFPLWVYIFNVADVMLVVGVGMLLIYWYVVPLFKRWRKAPEPTEEPPAQPVACPACPACMSDALPTCAPPAEPETLPPAAENPAPRPE